MKKILTSLILVLGLVLLAACTPTDNGDDDKDTTKPVIVGADPVTITVGDTFDPLAGVSASDDVDGTITLTSANVTGTVNTAEPGTYTLTYKVSDAAGNEATKERVITVVAQAPLGNLIGGDFERETLNGVEGWTTWHDSGQGYDATYEIVNGELVIDITNSGEADTQWWAVQVQYNKIILEPFVSYKLEFKVKADETRYMNYQIQGGELPDGGKAFGESNFTEITTEWQTISKEFYVKGEGVDAQLQFAFGNFAESTGVPAEYKRVLTKVYLDDVRIVAGPELENQAPSITAPNLTIKTGTGTPIKTGISVQDDFTNIQVADVEVVQDEEDAVVFNPQSPAKGVYNFTVTAEDDEGLVTTVTRTITVTDPWNRPEEFTVGEEAVGWFVRQLDRVEDEDWLSFVDNEDGSVDITIEKMATGDWQASYRMSNVQFFKGTYTIKFDVKSVIARDIRVAVEQAGLPSEVAFQHIEATTEWTTITLVYVFETDQFNKGFEFWLGTLTTNRVDPNPYTAADDILTTVSFRNFEVTYEV